MTQQQKNQLIEDLANNDLLKGYSDCQYRDDGVYLHYKIIGSAKCKALLEYCEANNLQFLFLNSRKKFTVSIY